MSIDEKYISGKSIFTNRSLKVEITAGVVTSIVETEDCSNYLSPGFVDIQFNGYNAKDYSADLDSAQIMELVYDLAKSGTTKHFPTIITNPEPQILRSLQNIVKARKASHLVETAIPGIHVEGPFISPKEGARGAHDPQYIRDADYDEFLRWQDAAEGLIKIVTVSPENTRAIDFIRKITESGLVVAIGHTSVSVEMINKAVEAGAQLSTHLGNGCPALIPRLDNFIWEQLSEDRLAATIIADGFHLPPSVLKCFTKGKENTILISDAASLAGSKPGLYKWGNLDIEVFEDGHMGLPNTTNLAGATSLLDKCISHLTQQTQFSLSDSVRSATVNPRKLVGIPGWEGEPCVGDSADITSFTLVDNALRINRVIGSDTELYNNNGEK